MGSQGDKPRKPRRRLPKVPKYEEPNEIPLAGLGGGAPTGLGRFGHSADHHHNQPPGRFGRTFLRALGLKPKQPPE
ncbi:MAG TPA: hypothetical protein VHW47_04505 [Acidimicrobiales bacterium]|jgi:hypothetical protein|nr:hypothetical protein [Acidimicrobiales bacterium]